jgi:hypothetical protein
MVNWLPSIPITGKVEFPGLFESRAILLSIISTLPPVWRKAGYLRIEAAIDGEFFTIGYQAVEFGKSLISIPASSYRLSFDPVGQLTTIYPNTSISLYPLSPLEVSQIVPNYSPIPTSFADQPVLDSLPTSFSAPQYLVATLPAGYQCLPANAARQSFAVTNTGTAPIYLDLDAPSALTKRFTAVAVGGTYVSDFPYVGAVFIWSTNATAQPCEIREFIQ